MGAGTLSAKMPANADQKTADQKGVHMDSTKEHRTDTNVKVPLISKIAYGMGDVGCNFSWMFVGNFLMRRDLSRLFSPAEYKCPTLL